MVCFSWDCPFFLILDSHYFFSLSGQPLPLTPKLAAYSDLLWWSGFSFGHPLVLSYEALRVLIASPVPCAYF